MKPTRSLLLGGMLLALAGLGCEGPMGPEGPQGPQGPEGPQGPTGPTGPAGQDVNTACTQCHVSSTELFAREIQYQSSVHYLGGNFERSTTDCAPCHTHEGFIERLSTGQHTTAADIQNPSPVNCRTCHRIHTTYTEADFQLTTTAPVNLWIGGTVDLGKGNLCAQCHQARPLSAAEKPTIDGPPVEVSSSRYGYHHGPQAEVLGGVGGFEFDGSIPIYGGPGRHGESDVGCPRCHMADPFGAQAGGHTWNMTYEYHGAEEDLVAGCQTCHSTALDFNYLGFQAQIEEKMEELQASLRNVGIMSATSESFVPGTWPANVAAAAVNWQMVNEDRSHGIHNPPYVLGLLTNSIEALEPFLK